MEAKLVVFLSGLNCPHCAAKIEHDTKKLSGVSEAELNLMKQEMTVFPSREAEAEPGSLVSEIRKIVKKYEPSVAVSVHGGAAAGAIEQNHGHSHEHGHSHSHEHGHSHGGEDAEEFAEELRKKAWVFGLGIAAFLAGVLPVIPEDVQPVLLIVSYLLFGYEVVWTAIKNIGKGQVFDENFLMSVSTIGAIAIGELSEAVFVMLFYQIGETFQDLAVHRSRKSIKELMDIRPDAAALIKGDTIEVVGPETVLVGAQILVKPGEKIPLDGVIVKGEGYIDTSALTGESVPRKKAAGDTVLSGTINQNGLLTIEVTKAFAESTAVKILELVENASAKKSKTEQFITRFARIYTPLVVAAALCLAFLPTLFGAGGGLSMWVGRALIFLVISCPCALVLSVPLGFFSGIGEASRQGILVKGSNYLQALADVDTVVLDKTGTLTKGVFCVTEILPEPGFTKESLLAQAASLESMSNHPIAKSIVEAYETEHGPLSKQALPGYEELSGRGVRALVSGRNVFAGNARLMEEQGVAHTPYDGMGSVVYLAADGRYAGCIVVADQIKEDSREAILKLKKQGVQKVVMLTGDNEATAEKVAGLVGVDMVFAGLLPDQKVEKLELLFAEQTGKGKIAFVGDGVNDAPVLARADLGIAMGGMGSDAAIEAADVVIMDDALPKIADGMVIARKTNQIVSQNIVFALGVKAAVLLLGALGMASMWMAVFADVGVAFLAILNSMRKKSI